MSVSAKVETRKPTGGGSLPWPAALFLAAIISLAVLSTVEAAGREDPWQPLRFSVYLVFSVAASVLKVGLPSVRGNMSANVFFFMLSMVSLSSLETVIIGLISAVAQTLWRPKSKPNLVRAGFNASLIMLAVWVGWRVFHIGSFGSITIPHYVSLFLMAAAYFVCNTAPVAVMISLTEARPLLKTWRDTYFWVFSNYLLGAAVTAIMGAVEQTMGWEAAVCIVPVVYMTYRLYSQYLGQVVAEKSQAEFERAQADAQRAHAEQVSALHLRTIEALALAIEAKDQTTHDHLQRVQIYSVELAKLMNLGDDQIQALQAAALLHDIGKLAVPEHIISKPGKLTREEFEKMKIHPVVGAEILEHVQFPYPVEPIVRHHHERWDGTGYPAGLKGEQIPIGARILSAVDCLDALASHRQYRKALPLDDAMAAVVKMAGINYDPDVVEILRRHYREWELKTLPTTASRSRLSTDIRARRGDSPATGLSTNSSELAGGRKETTEFLSSIGAARHEAQVLFELTQDMGSTLALDEMLSVVALRLKKLVPHDSFAVYLRKGGELEPAFVSGDDFRLFSSLRIPLGQGLSGWVVTHQQPIVNGDPARETSHLSAAPRAPKLQSALCIPLGDGEQTMGALGLYAAASDAFTQDHLRILMMIGSKLSQSIQNSLVFRRAEDTSLTDYLTGLPNARSLFHHLEGSLKTHPLLSVLVCDLDGFKGVNDQFGHQEGDRLLKEVANALRRSCRVDDYVARMGGDEFVLVLPGMNATQHPEKLDAIINAVEAVGLERFGKVIVSLSIGVALVPEDGVEQEKIIAAGDHRMYKTKARRKGDKARLAETASLLPPPSESQPIDPESLAKLSEIPRNPTALTVSNDQLP
ncbi:MAG: diguanylate cyclase [Acidobacteria bacterium]|jgi:diguanylate cyclase (GGDEF)-like protein/putative nucleotidyltransferase with HDIG domain|nr:diguanylate cyclase [Bryobacteraceae bacterium CoA2 C42]